MRTVLCESGGTLRASEGKWSATLLTPGPGSSGTYTEEMLAEYGARAFPKGMKLWWGHPKEGEGPGDRDPRDQWGVLESDAEFVAGEGLVGKVRLLPHWKDVVESLGDQASLSIYALGESNESGDVIALHEDATNSVDIVSYPGRPGSGLKKKLEAARAASAQPGSISAQESNNQEESAMEEVLKAVEALTKLFTDHLAEQKAEADKARQAEADAEAQGKDVTEAVEAAVKSVEAVKAAALLPSLETPLVEAAKRGEDVTAGIEAAKKVMEEAITASKGDAHLGYVHESASGKDEDFSFNFGGGR